MTYDIKYKETSIGWFEVEAGSYEGAVRKFWEEVESGKIDLLDSEIIESSAIAYEKD